MILKDLKAERIRVLSGSNTFTLSVSQAAVPTHVEPVGSIAKGTDGSMWRSLGGGSWTAWGDNPGLSGSFEGAFAAMSGSNDGRFRALSGSADGHFNQLSGTVDARFSSYSADPTGTLQMTSGSQSAVNASDEGNIDWLVIHSSSPNPWRSTAASSVHSKRGGGFLRESFEWVFAGQSLTIGTTSPGSGVSTNASESTFNSTALSAATTKGRIFSTSSPSDGWGFHLRVPAGSETRVLRLAVSLTNVVVAFSASLTDGSATPVRAVCDSNGVATRNISLQTVFNSRKGGELVLTCTAVGRYNTSPEIAVGWMTLSGNLP